MTTFKRLRILLFPCMAIAFGTNIVLAAPIPQVEQQDDTPRVVPMSDGAGEITELGSEVERWQVGDRVMASFTRDWTSGLVNEKASREKALRSGPGGRIEGVFAESVTMDSSALVRIPEHLIYQQASTSRCAAVTACNALASAAKHDILRRNRRLRHHKIPPGGML